MNKQLLPVGTIPGMPVLHFPCQSNADLPDMIGGEGGGDRDALCLTEGIVLHGGHKVDNHLYDLYRGGVRQKAQKTAPPESPPGSASYPIGWPADA